MIDELTILRTETKWKKLPLGSVFKTTSGGTPSRKNPAFYNGNIPWVKSGELESNIIVDTEEKITQEAINASSAKIFPKGTLLIALYGATIGKLAKLGIDAATNQAVCGIFENEEHDLDYLYWFLFHKRRDLIKAGIGGAQPNISQTILKNLEVPLPKKEVQQQIVSRIEELFSELDKSTKQLKTTQQQLKVYRQSVLKWAFEGKLTNENVKNGNLPDGWKTIQIEDIASVGTGATPLKGKKEYYQDGKIPWVTSGSLNEEYVTAPTEFVTERALKETNLTVYPKHTLLLAMYGEGKTRGKCSELLIEATTNQAIAAIHFTKHDVQVKPFLKYFLLKNYNDIRRLSSGGVQPNLNLGIVKRTMLPFPPLEEQNRIVEEIESRLSVADKLEETIANSLQQTEALRQSILKKAFEGKLH
jgi:type I restriction enzyme S subunit